MSFRLIVSVVASVGAGTLWAFGMFGLGSAAAALAGACLLGTREQPAGWLTALAARLGEFALLSGLLVYYRHDDWMLATGLIAMLGSLLVSYSTVKAEALQVRLEPGFMRGSQRFVWLISAAVVDSLLTFMGAESWGRAILSTSVACYAALSLVASVMRYTEIVGELRAEKGREPKGTLS